MDPSSTMPHMTKNTPYASSRRDVVARQWIERFLAGLAKAVSRSTHGADQRWLAVDIDLAAQARDMHIDEIGTRIEAQAPYAFENHRARQHLPGITHQEFQQAIFGGQQRQFAPAATCDARDHVEF